MLEGKRFLLMYFSGMVFSSKYTSTSKCFPHPHVIIFTNRDIPDDAFSADRPKRRWLSDPAEDRQIFLYVLRKVQKRDVLIICLYGG